MNRTITIAGLLIFTVIILLPPIIHGYVYPNMGDDAAGHLDVFDSMQAGKPIVFGYLGYVIVGYPLVWISNLFNISIDSIYLWFNFMALALVGITLYFVMSRLVNRQTGWLALIITLFCAQGILFQFYFGQMFNFINMGIILPWLLFFTVRYLTDKRIYQLVLVIFLAGLFGLFHTSGIYLPFIAGLTVVAYVVYSRVRRQSMQLRGIVLGGSILLSVIIATVFIDPYAFFKSSNFEEILHQLFIDLPYRLSVPVAHYVLDIVSLTVLVILIFASVFHREILKNIRSELKILLTILLCAASLLFVATFVKLSVDTWRTALDLATILALIAAISVGLILKQQKNKLVAIIPIIIVGVGLFLNIPAWFDYNSAIRPIDKQVIAYVNSSDYESYACSAEVAPWIYNRFIEAEYRTEMTCYWDIVLEEDHVIAESDADLIIVRSEPMTPRSDKDNMWYQHHGIIPNERFEVTPISRYKARHTAFIKVLPDDSFELTKVFKDGQVEISLYERK